MQKTKAIIIGGGVNSAVGRVHFEALKLADIEVIDGYFSRNHELDKESRIKWGLTAENHHNSIEDLCTKYRTSDMDLVAIVLTPTPNHYQSIIKLLECNLNIICEKPLSISRKQIEKIKEIASKKERIIRCTYNYGGYPMFRELTEKVKNGKIGKINQLILQMPQEGLIKPPNIAGEKKPPQKWRLEDPKETSMANLDLGAHLYQLGKMITGEKIEVIACCMDNFTRYEKINDTSYAIIKTKGGIKGMFWITKSMLGSRNGLHLTVIGEKGTFKWTQTEPEILEYSDTEVLSTVIDRGSKCIEANKQRYERMKPGHPAGYIEAFANTYIDIHNEIIEWKNTGTDVSKYGLDVETSLEIATFLEDLKVKSLKA